MPQLERMLTIVGCGNESGFKFLGKYLDLETLNKEAISQGCLKKVLPDIDGKCLNLLSVIMV